MAKINRRKFMSLLGAVPLSLAQNWQSDFAEAKPADAGPGDLPSFAIHDGWPARPRTPLATDGIRTGIRAIDELTNGFFGGQIVGVTCALDNIALSFLAGVAVDAAMNQKEVDYVASESDGKKYLERRFSYLQPKNANTLKNLIFDKENGNRRELLRFVDIDLGDPSNRGWKDYLSVLRDAPPAIMILDGIESIEEFMDEKNMKLQLQELAKELDIPVLLKVPGNAVNVSPAGSKHNGIRQDFEDLCNVVISFSPQFICDQYSVGYMRAKYYLLDTVISGTWCPCSKHSGYAGQLKLQFTDHFAQVDGRSMPDSFSSM